MGLSKEKKFEQCRTNQLLFSNFIHNLLHPKQNQNKYKMLSHNLTLLKSNSKALNEYREKNLARWKIRFLNGYKAEFRDTQNFM